MLDTSIGRWLEEDPKDFEKEKGTQLNAIRLSVISSES